MRKPGKVVRRLVYYVLMWDAIVLFSIVSSANRVLVAQFPSSLGTFSMAALPSLPGPVHGVSVTSSSSGVVVVGGIFVGIGRNSRALARAARAWRASARVLRSEQTQGCQRNVGRVSGLCQPTWAQVLRRGHTIAPRCRNTRVFVSSHALSWRVPTHPSLEWCP